MEETDPLIGQLAKILAYARSTWQPDWSRTSNHRPTQTLDEHTAKILIELGWVPT